MRKGRRRALVGACGLALGLALPASAQPAPREMTFADLALTWADGDYVGPVLCQLAEGPRRVARNVRIEPVRRRTYRSIHAVQFQSLEVAGAPCKSDLGDEEPDVEGRLEISIQSRPRPDTAKLDFDNALRRDGGFHFEVLEGRVTVRDRAGERSVDLAGGKASMLRVEAGSDAARMLGDFERAPRRTLILEARDGTRLAFHLAGVPPRR